MIDVIKAALEAAKVSIQIDRSSLADSSMRADNTMEPEGAAGVAEYDAVLAQLDGALATLQAQPAVAPTEHIKEPYTLAELNALIASNDYSAELLLQHAMLLLNAQPAEVSDAMNEALKALDAVAAWQLPQVPDRRSEDPSATVPYGVAYGSNGERDYMRSLAQTAAKRARAILALRPQSVPMTDEQAKQFLKRSALLDMFLHIGWYSAPRKGFDEHALSLIRAVEAHHGITAPAGGEKQA